MEKQTVYITKYTLSPLFEKTLKLLKPTWKSSLISSAILMAPLAVMYGLFMQYFMSAYFNFLQKIIDNGESAFSGLASSMVGQLLPLSGFVLVFGLLSGIIESYAAGVVSRNGFRCASGESPTWQGLMLEVLRGKLGSLVVFYILETLILIGVAIVLAIPIGILIGVAVATKSIVAPILLGLLLYLVLIAVLVALALVFRFGPTVIVNEDIGGAAAISRCFALIKGEFFRVLGISILFSLALSFALNIVLMPFTFLASIPMYAKMFQSGFGGAESDPSTMMSSMRDLFSGMGPLLGISFGLSSILSYLVHPLFITLFYIDLRVRKGDLSDAAAYTDLSGQGQA
jgi:hypothetical protein